jgi:hypothetical protein
MNPFKVDIKNPITGNVVSDDITEYVPQKGRAKGSVKLQPKDFAKWRLSDFEQRWGEQTVLKVLVLPRFKALLSTFTEEALHKDEDTLETDPNVIIKDYAEMYGKLSQRGETIMALTRRLNEIREEEMPDLLDKLDDVVQDTEEEKNLLKEIKALRDEQKELKVQIETKKVKREKVEDNGTAPTPAPVAA